MIQFPSDYWAVILGGSSGFGLATAQKLSRHGMSVCVVHRDRRGAMSNIQPHFDEIAARGHGVLAINTNALDDGGRLKVLDALTEAMGDLGRVRMLMHSIALGNLKPLAPPVSDDRTERALTALAEELKIDPALLADKAKVVFDEGAVALHGLIKAEYPDRFLDDEDFAQTIYAMGTSLLPWVRDIHSGGMFADDARVLGMTSEGNELAWRGYAAVSAAKLALESASRSIALEYAPYGVRSNIIQAGVTDTPALRAIPGNAQMKAESSLRNPLRRLTRPEDVADFICLMCTDEAAWVNGSLLRVDGGEHIASA
jgi:NAD(P)-dependent dehydrogenase (short-subunit alcohol dehydrogenase family)